MDTVIEAALIQAVPPALLSIAALSAGIWALHNYRNDRRLEAARWVQDLYRDFYHSPRFGRVRTAIEYKYFDELTWLVQKRISDRDVVLTDVEMTELQRVDLFLNYFENILYLLEERRVSRGDIMAIFQYWFELMAKDQCGALRSYLAFGFERLSSELGAKLCMAVFLTNNQVGKLSEAGGAFAASLRNQQSAEAECRCLVEFELVAQLSDGGGRTLGRLWSFDNAKDGFAMAHRIDASFGFDPRNPHAGKIVRSCVRVRRIDGTQPQDAWIYADTQTAGPAGGKNA